MNAQTLVTRYLRGNPLSRDERNALARQLKGAHNASRAIRLAREEAAARLAGMNFVKHETPRPVQWHRRVRTRRAMGGNADDRIC